MNTTKVKEQGKEERQVAKATSEEAPAKENEKPSCGCCGGRNTEKKQHDKRWWSWLSSKLHLRRKILERD
ncbi:MAG: hypothetical protein M3209_04305 [Acidobacteriota bacterium]|nr:hypothetical protein [Acidobacteriota bacterium]